MSKSTIAALVFAILSLSACGKTESTAGKYVAAHSSDAKPKPKVEEKKPGETKTETGDVEKGKTLLASCGGCHNDSGLGKAVILNAASVSKLESAITGDKKGYHDNIKTSFEGENRKNLEAAMNAVK